MAEVAGEGEDSDEDEEHSEESGDEEEGQEEVEEAEIIETSTTSTTAEPIPQPPLELESLSLSNLDLSEIHGDSNSDSEDDNDNDSDAESYDDRESLADSISHRRHRPSTRVPPPSAAEVGTIVTERLARLKRNTERKHGGRAQSANVLGKQKGSKMKNDTRRAIKDNAQF